LAVTLAVNNLPSIVCCPSLPASLGRSE